MHLQDALVQRVNVAAKIDRSLCEDVYVSNVKCCSDEEAFSHEPVKARTAT